MNRINEIRVEIGSGILRTSHVTLLLAEVDRLTADISHEVQWRERVIAERAAAEARAVVAEAQVQRVENLCEVVRALQQPDPYTGDRDISFLAVRAALAGEEEA